MTNSIVEKLKASQQQELERVKIDAVAKVATQAAHDIRSPLEVLKTLSDEMANFPDSTKRRIQLCINRIEEITFHLLRKHKESVGLVSDLNCDLLALLNSVITEKVIEFKKHPKVRIEERFSKDCYGAFSVVDRASLKAVISNLINNSVESLEGKDGFVGLELVTSNDYNIINIADSGVGIPDHVAKKLFTKGFTTKADGNGLGLHNARQLIEGMGGSLTFSSELGKGTIFTLKLPNSEPPLTFLSSIDLNEYDRVIVLDDDLSFHEVWSQILHIHVDLIEHFYSVQDILGKYHVLDSRTILLSDFELMDKDMDGIDTILKLNHSSHSVLVTARSEEISIQERCLRKGIKLLPKSLVSFLPIVEKENTQKVNQNIKPTIILIDDDKLVRINWSNFCHKNNFEFQSFHSIDSFMIHASSVAKDSVIYIDSHLEGSKGEVESKKIFDFGFKNLYLCTGYQPDDIEIPFWIMGIFSKSPDCIRNLKKF
jgi:FixJ family two-component response regulator